MMSEHLEGLIREHVCWRSMRDRLPVSQVDELVGEQASAPKQEQEVARRKARVRVRGKQNLCVIRSGQDWSQTTSAERELYLVRTRPVPVEVWVLAGSRWGARAL